MSAVAKRSTILATALLLAGVVLIYTGQRILTEPSISQMLTYGGLLVLLVAVGLRVAAFATAHGDVRGVEGRLLGAYAGVCGSLLLYALSTPWAAEKLGFSPELAEKVSGPLYVLWTAVVLVSLFAILFIEIVYLRMPIAESVELRRVRTSLQAGVTLALTIVFLLSANYVATARDVRKDVSYFRTTEPSKSTLALVQKLDKPMHVILFYHQGSDVLGQVKPYFDSLAAQNKKLSYEVTDVALAPELASKHKVRDNGNVLLVTGLQDPPPPKDDKAKDDAAKDDKAKDDAAKDAKARIENSKGDSFRIGTELTESRVTLRKLDATFQQSFTKLTRPERTLYLTVGHGEHNAKGTDQKPEDGTTTMNEILRRLNLKTQELGLAQGLGSKVPDNASAVLIIGPTEPFMREEVNTLVDYVRKGGRVLAMLEPGADAGLGVLLESLGVELLPGVASSETSHMARNYNDSDKGIVFSNRYSSHPSVTTVSRHQREVATVFVNGGGLKQVTGTAEPKPKVTFPLRSDPQFWRDLDGNFKRDAQEKTEMLNMVAAVSIDRTGSPAAKPKDAVDAKPDAKNDSGEGRSVVIADGDFITNKIAPNNGNLLLFVDSLAWLVGNEDLSGESSSEEDIAIEHTSDRDKVWFYGTTFVVPLPIALAGVWVARRRRRRAEVKS
jgi:hypothetical protein